MILQALTEYYERLAEQGIVSKPGWSTAKVSDAIVLDFDGQIIGVLPLKEVIIRGTKKMEVLRDCRVPQMVSRSSGIKANFLCDNAKYILGIVEKKKDGKESDKETEGVDEKELSRAFECFETAKKLHLQILKQVQGDVAQAVCRFFETWNPRKARENSIISQNWDELTAGGNLVFYINGKYAQEDHAVAMIWEKACAESDGTEEQIGRCLVTGKQTEIARIHTAIKGVRGAQSSGAALVSFNALAFESYGKEQSYNAPVGKYAMFAYTTALNYLLTQSKYVKLLGDTTVVYWSEDANIECKDLFLAASEPTTDNQELLDGVFSNLEKGYAVDVDSVYKNINLNQRFYILGIAPNAARLSVRFFYIDEFGKILQHLKQHYDRMEVVRPAKDTIHYMGIWRMLQETVNKKSKDKSPQAGMAGRTFSAILSGGRYPESMYFAVLERIRAEQDDSDTHSYKITRGRAGIIKAYLIRNTKSLQGREVLFVALNEACNDVAYVLGREFSVLEDIQQTANPGINATIKDRYFNSACATPAIIFPVLYKLKNSHVRKLLVGNAIYFEKILTSLQAKLPAEGLPQRLTLEQQGKFILGYYHQTQKRYEKKGEE